MMARSGGTLALQSPETSENPRDHQHVPDRPKSMHPIPGHTEWVLVKTRLRRRFVHNLTFRKSYWKIPSILSQSLVDFDGKERQRQHTRGKRRGEVSMKLISGMSMDGVGHETDADLSGNEVLENKFESAEIVELEASKSGSDSDEPRHTRKRSISDNDEHAHEDEKGYGEDVQQIATRGNGPQELGEDDMVAQLAAMGEAYKLDRTEYFTTEATEEIMEGEEGIAHELSQDEAIASFQDMLDDHAIDPYSTWDNIIDSQSTSSTIISDDRYTLLPTMKLRRIVFSDWSSARINDSKTSREKKVKQNPRIPYLTFLGKRAKPKLYWAEFRRKWKLEPEMRDPKLTEKQREKLYREHIFRITNMSEQSRMEDLKTLMRSLSPGPSWNSTSGIDGVMPEELLADVRYVSVKVEDRRKLVADFARTLPAADEALTGSVFTEDNGQNERP